MLQAPGWYVPSSNAIGSSAAAAVAWPLIGAARCISSVVMVDGWYPHSIRRLVGRPRRDRHAAETGLRVQSCFDTVSQSIDESFGQRQVHAADERPVLVDKRVERAVGEADLAAFRLERGVAALAQCLDKRCVALPSASSGSGPLAGG